MKTLLQVLVVMSVLFFPSRVYADTHIEEPLTIDTLCQVNSFDLFDSDHRFQVQV